MTAIMNHLSITPRRQSAATCVVPQSHQKLLADVSIVIPVAPEEEAWRSLVGDLLANGVDAELLLVGAYAEPMELRKLRAAAGPTRRIRWMAAPAGRAHQMNYGAKLSIRQFLWFLHADSRVSGNALSALERSLDAHSQALHYFDLAYQDDGPTLARLNAVGVRFRSRFLGLPFGDQGLCLSRRTFEHVGGFDETATYGEDHLLVWAARRHRVPLHCVGAIITTSARKYRTNGWFTTTLLHGWRTWRQAAPEFFRSLWTRCP
ncbi:MAG: glycosyltransferase family 2 protein [Planctomycetes bacterium]|nr:glycosyltransferase family 2 protein [Planctomycetota bacterium]